MTIKEIYAAIDNGLNVNWSSELYYVHIIEVKKHNKYTKISKRKNNCLRITCTSNGFGSVVHLSDLKKCYINLAEKIN